MTVAELIEQLSQYPAEMLVTVDSSDNECHPWNREAPVLVTETLAVVHKGAERLKSPWPVVER